MTSSLTNTMNITSTPEPSQCYDKCLYSFNYPNSNFCTFTNMDQQYFNLSYNNSTTNPPANFNSVDYTVDRVCIYFPSLHNFNNVPVSGEIVIYHTGTDATKLNVCIPLNVDGGTSSPLLNNIFNEVISNQYTDNDPHDLSLDVDYNLNDFVKYAPYYYYYDNEVNFIVYGLNDGILVTKNVYETIITTLITKPYQPFQSISYLSYNDRGPYNTAGDEIYIDCQPVDSDGNLLIDKSNKDFYKNFGIGPESKTMNIIFFSIFIVTLIFLMIIYATGFTWKKLSNTGTGSIQTVVNHITSSSTTTSPISTTNTLLSRNFELGFDGIAKFLGFA
jgi:hypothetical protein